MQKILCGYEGTGNVFQLFDYSINPSVSKLKLYGDGNRLIA